MLAVAITAPAVMAALHGAGWAVKAPSSADKWALLLGHVILWLFDSVVVTACVLGVLEIAR